MNSSLLSGKLFQWSLLSLLLILLFSYQGKAQSRVGDKITVEPTAVVSWDDLLRLEAQRGPIPVQARENPEPRPGRGPRPIQRQPGGVQRSSGVPPSALNMGNIQMTVLSDATAQSGPASKSFDALLDANQVIPPDTYGSVGPSHLMTMLNDQVKIQNKNGDSLSQMSVGTFWSKIPGSNSLTDPRVQYDAIHGKWLAIIDANPQRTNAALFFAISANTDPTGTWTYYSMKVDSPGTKLNIWADYPSLGFNKNWIAIAANMFPLISGNTGVKLWAIDQSSVQSGGALRATVFPFDFDTVGGASSWTLQPCVTMDTTSALYLVDNSGWYDNTDTTFLLRMSRLTGTGASPTWAPVSGSVYGPGNTGLFSVANNFNASQKNANQLGSDSLIATNDFRMMNAVFRNGTIWCTHSGGLPPKIAPTPNRTAVFWDQLNPSSTFDPIVQSGMLDGGTNVHYFFPSISANKNNDVCLGFTRSDPTRYAEAVFTGRLSTDAAGTMQAIQVFKAGVSSYTKYYSGTRNRWGDYSNTCVDPTDDVTFWLIQEYAGQNQGSGKDQGEWATRWAQVIPGISLPIQLASFNGVATPDHHVRLTWQTLTETNNYGFEVEKSPDGPNGYQRIPNSFIAGHGTTVLPQKYSYTDMTVTEGNWWYRLKQIDLDGTVHYTDGVGVSILTSVAQSTHPLKTSLAQNFPNPFNPSTRINFTLAKPGLVTITVYNMLGEEVAILLKTEKEAGEHTLAWSPVNLASGSYIYRLQANGYVENRKLVLLK